MTEHMDEAEVVDSLKNITAELSNLNGYEDTISKQYSDLKTQILRFQGMMKSWDGSLTKQMNELNRISKALDQKMQDCNSKIDDLMMKTSILVESIEKMEERMTELDEAIDGLEEKIESNDSQE